MSMRMWFSGRVAALLLAGLVLCPVLALAGVSDEDWKKAEEEYNKLWKANDRVAAVKVLAGVSDVRAVKELWKILTKFRPDQAVESAIKDALARVSDEASIEFLAGAVADKGLKPEQRLVLCQALGSFKNDKVAAAMMSMLEDKDVLVKISAIDTLGVMGHKDATPKIAAALDHEEWQVRSSAILALVRLMDERGVEPLINRMDKEKGRLEGDIIKALRAMTGQAKESAVEWRAWWTGNKAAGLVGGGYESWKDFKATGTAVEPTADSSGSVPTYYGIKIYSKRLIFVIDMSGSMDEPWRGKPPAAPQQTVEITGNDDAKVKEKPKKATLDWTKVKTKWDLAREHLVFTLKQLPSSAEFTIISYHDKVVVWQPKLVKATQENINAAIIMVRKIKPQMATNIHGALQKAFQIGGPEGNTESEKPLEMSGDQQAERKDGGDTIFFLTDGWPTAGKILWKKPGAKKTNEDWQDQMMEEVKKWNATRKLTVHTVGIGNHCKELMNALATEFGGEYVIPGNDDGEEGGE